MSQYKQCFLQRKAVSVTAWIPTAFAIEGKIVKIKGRDGEWEDGWRVASVYDGTKTQEELNKQRSTQRHYADVLDGH